MAKPIVIAKREGPDWVIDYTNNDTGEAASMSVIGSPTIDDALKEARTSLDAALKDWYVITRIELNKTT
jgi:hypothetical protein